jgi:hypothetical protein
MPPVSIISPMLDEQTYSWNPDNENLWTSQINITVEEDFHTIKLVLFSVAKLFSSGRIAIEQSLFPWLF